MSTIDAEVIIKIVHKNHNYSLVKNLDTHIIPPCVPACRKIVNLVFDKLFYGTNWFVNIWLKQSRIRNLKHQIVNIETFLVLLDIYLVFTPYKARYLPVAQISLQTNIIMIFPRKIHYSFLSARKWNPSVSPSDITKDFRKISGSEYFFLIRHSSLLCWLDDFDFWL